MFPVGDGGGPAGALGSFDPHEAGDQILAKGFDEHLVLLERVQRAGQVVRRMPIGVRCRLDVTSAYLRGELPGQAAGARRDHPVKQMGWAEMQLRHEQSRALLYRAIDEATLDPTEEQLVTGWCAAATVMENAAWVSSTAIRVCGGQAMLKHLPLERLYRDARLGSTMLPWSAEVCIERLGRARFYS